MIEREDRWAKAREAEILTPEGDMPAPPAILSDPAFAAAADFASRRV